MIDIHVLYMGMYECIFGIISYYLYNFHLPEYEVSSLHTHVDSCALSFEVFGRELMDKS